MQRHRQESLPWGVAGQRIPADGPTACKGDGRDAVQKHYYAWQVGKALCIADKKNLAGIDCIQMVYNLLARDAELEMTRLCEAGGIGISVWGALAGGMLSGRFLEHDPSRPPPDGVKPYPSTWRPRYFEAVRRLKEIAGERSLTQFAPAWMLQSPEDVEACDGVWRELRPAPVMFYARGYGIDFN